MNYTKAQIIEKSADEFTAIASTETRDRHGDVIVQDGWQLKQYKDNPVLLFMHDHYSPIGRATKIWVDKSSGKAKLMFKGVISSATEQARAAKQLMQEGILNSFSVGFMPLEMDGSNITKSELHEISLVAVPANPDARLQAAKMLKTAGFNENVIKTFTEESTKKSTAELEDEIAQLNKKLEAVKQTAEVAVKGLQHLASPKVKQEVVTERLRYSRVIAKASDKLLAKNVSSATTAVQAKIIKRASEKLIRSNKGDL